MVCLVLDGWIMELFSNWFSNHFLKHAISSCLLLLLLDGHSSHYYTLDLIKSAADDDELYSVCHPIRRLLTINHLILAAFAL